MTESDLASAQASERLRIRIDFELLAVMAAAAAVAGWYIARTGHIWEDYFITFRHSRNLVEGNGLLYQPGERVHGFTSPLGVLLPALFHWLTGATSYEPALRCFRLLSVAALAGCAGLSILALRTGGCGRPVRVFWAAIFLLESKSVAFSTNGMETGLMLFFLAWSFYYLVRGIDEHWLASGLGWAGLMWTRPDGCVYVAVIMLAALVFADGPRRSVWGGIVRACLLCTVLYLPWFIWAWSYYGSPIPHTILAKSRYDGGLLEQTNVWLRGFPSRFWLRSGAVFQPIYALMGPWPTVLFAATQLLALAACLLWAVPAAGRVATIASFLLAWLCVYLTMMQSLFPWYLPPATWCGSVALAAGSFAIAERASLHARLCTRLAGVFCGVAVLCSLFMLVTVAKQMEIQQREIETGNRMLIGLWLREHVQPGETVYTESLGYIGYFSNAHMLDYPGLVSPSVVRCRREHGDGFEKTLRILKPDWVVARFHELAKFRQLDEFDKCYQPQRIFDVSRRLEAYGEVYGKQYLAYDASFGVFRRVPADGGSTHKPGS